MDFDKRLQERRKAFDEEQAKLEQEAEAKRQEKQDKISASIKIIREFVLPTLLSAKKSLQENEFDLLIKDEFSDQMSITARPIISATCGSFARKSDGYRMESRPIIIEASDGKLKIGFGQEYNRHRISELVATTNPEDADDIIKENILKLTDEALEKYRAHNGPWK